MTAGIRSCDAKTGALCAANTQRPWSKGRRYAPSSDDFVKVNAPEGHDKGIIESICPRERAFVRKDPTERAVPQVLAANFDRVILAQPLAEVNLRRLERELVLAYETGAAVTVVLTKADLAESEEQVEQVARPRPRAGRPRRAHVGGVGTATPKAWRPCAPSWPPAPPRCWWASPGVGKSSLVNMLVGEEVQETGTVREGDGKGRHTTVSREMVAVPGGGYVVDMPGVRGLGLWDADAGIGAAFADIEQAARAVPLPRLQARERTGLRRARRRRVRRDSPRAFRQLPGPQAGDAPRCATAARRHVACAARRRSDKKRGGQGGRPGRGKRRR